MAFAQTSGTMQFLFYWNGELTSWNPTKVPNYNAQLRHWRTSLTQRRLNISFIDPDGDIYGSLHDSGTALDSAMWLCGRLVGESYATLARMSCMYYNYDAGITSIRVGDSLERLRSARTLTTWRRAVAGSSSPTTDGRVYVTGISGAEVFFTPPVSIDSSGSLAYFYFGGNDGAVEGDLPCSSGGLVAFGTVPYTGGYPSGDDANLVHYKTPSVVEHFPHVLGTNIATSVRLSAPPENCGSGWAFSVAEPGTFIGNPMALLHVFLTATCCDLGWHEGVEFDYVNGDTWDEDPCAHTELVVTPKTGVDSSASLLSVIDKIAEAGNLDIFTDRTGMVWVSPYRPRYLSDAPDGTLLSNQVALKPLSPSVDIADVVNKFEIKYGAELDAEAVVVAPDTWAGSVGSTHSRTIRNSFLRQADDAICMGYRKLRREYRGVEHLTIKCLPQAATVVLSGIQRLVTDFRSYGNTLWECVGVRDNWGEPSVTIRLADATTYYDQRGWGEWENSTGGNNLVAATSTFGWSNGTAGVSDGTIANINEDKYGSVYRWF